MEVNTLTFNWFSRWRRKEKKGKRLFLGLVFLATLTCCFHFREVVVDKLEPESVAEKYILAPVGFEFPDSAATTLLKQQALLDIGSVYRINEHEIRKWDDHMMTHFNSNRDWRESLPNTTFESMFQAKEAIREAFVKSRFTNARTLEQIKKCGLQEGYFLSVRDVIRMPSDEERYILENLVPDHWGMSEDLSAQNGIRQAVKHSIPMKMTHIEAGSHIINKGETVTHRHVDMLEAMKKVLSVNRNRLTPMNIFGSLLMSTLLVFLSTAYLRFQHPSILRSFNRLSALVTIMILTLLLSKLTEFLLVNQSSHLIDIFRYPIFVVFGTLLVSQLIGKEFALIFSCFVAVILSITLAVDYDHFLIVNLIAALVAVISVRKLRRRQEIFEVCAKVGIALIPIMVAFNLFDNTFWDLHLLTDLLTIFLFVGGTAVLVVGLLPILESSFGIVTDMTLMEYFDPSHPLLRRLSIEAPGTYQHSLFMGGLAEAAAQAIGCNGLFCRVAALYHDIGKLCNPLCFTENQQNAFNVHHLLTPIESAQIIISHVEEGVILAEKHSLPQPFIDIIREHHGTSLVYCFYRAEVEFKKGDRSLVSEDQFRYGGPKPRRKESAILMLCDTMEAAFRALEEVNEAAVASLIDRLVADKINDGQLDQSKLTFYELSLVKQSIVRTLLAARHTRTKYPDRFSNLEVSSEEFAPRPAPQKALSK